MIRISSSNMADSLNRQYLGSQRNDLDRRERSQNAKAQARHRAKRKAYIEQLEQMVVRLQNALSTSPGQDASLPPPVMRIRELEQENMSLSQEVEELRRQLEARNAYLCPDVDYRQHNLALYDDRPFDREAKRRRALQLPDEPYLLTNNRIPSLPLSAASSLSTYASSPPLGQQQIPSLRMKYPCGLANPMPGPLSGASSPLTKSFLASVLFVHRSASSSTQNTRTLDLSNIPQLTDLTFGLPELGPQHQGHMSARSYRNACGYDLVKVEEEPTRLRHTKYSHHIPQANGHSSRYLHSVSVRANGVPTQALGRA